MAYHYKKPASPYDFDPLKNAATGYKPKKEGLFSIVGAALKRAFEKKAKIS
jgi:hypothetical protein